MFTTRLNFTAMTGIRPIRRLRAPALNRRAESAERVSAQPGLNGHTRGTAVTFRISLVEQQDGKSIVGSHFMVVDG